MFLIGVLIWPRAMYNMLEKRHSSKAEASIANTSFRSNFLVTRGRDPIGDDHDVGFYEKDSVPAEPT
jgi:hypothetical protein